MDIIKSIQALAPDAQVTINAEDYEQITWHDGNPNNITVDHLSPNSVCQFNRSV